MSDTSMSSTSGASSEGRLPNGADAASAMSGAAGSARLKDAAGAVAGEVQSIVQDRMAQVRQAAAGAYDAAKVRGGATKDQMDDFVRTRPWEAVSFAALIGLAVGLYIAR
jgi:ElaB/YqjD/DUF883 family membrane-anchored ribosome-binding protein